MRTFKLSNDPKFAEKALASTSILLPMVLSSRSMRKAKSTPAGFSRRTMTHDYKRHGTTTLFASLNILDGTALSSAANMQRHRHADDGKRPLVHFMAELSFRSRKTASLELCCRLSLKYSVSITSALSARDLAIRHPRMQTNADETTQQRVMIASAGAARRLAHIFRTRRSAAWPNIF